MNKPIIRGLSLLTFMAAGQWVQAEPEDDENRILITATRLEREPNEVASKVTVISHETLEQQLADTLDDATRYQPGISIATASRGGNTGFQIRGMGGKRVLMLQDGVAAPDVFFAGPSAYGNDLLEVNDIQSIQILRGPGSALYGSDALGGVVIITSKSAQDYIQADNRWYTETRLQAGSGQDMVKLGGVLAAGDSQSGLLVKASRRRFHEQEVAGEGSQSPQSGDADSILVQWERRWSEAQKLSLSLDAFQEAIDYQLTVDPALPYLARDESDRYQVSVRWQAEFDTLLAEKLDLRAYWQDTKALQNSRQTRTTSFSFPDAPLGTPGPVLRESDFEFNQQLTGIELQLESYHEAQNGLELALAYGFEFRSKSTQRPRNRCETELASGRQTCVIRPYPFAQPEAFPNKTFADSDEARFAIFVQSEWNLGNSGVSLIPGLRYDRIDLDAVDAGVQEVIDFGYPIASTSHHQVSPSLGLVWDVSNQWQLSLQYAEGFRAPAYDEANQSFVNLAFGYAIVPNPDLKPESSEGIELDLRASLDDFELELSLYQNNYKDFISSSLVGVDNGILLFQDANLERVHIEGVELDTQWQFAEKWSWINRLAVSNGRNEVADTWVSQIDPASWVSGLRYEDSAWSVNLFVTGVRHKDRVAAEDEVTAGGYAVIDIHSQYHLSPATLVRLSVLNLADREYARWANIAGLNQGNERLPDLFQPGREFRLSLTHQF